MRLRLKLLAYTAVVGMALAAPAAQAVPVVGVTSDNTLFDFDTTAVGVNNVRAISGLSGTLFGIDYRPANGLLYALTSNAGTGLLYTINVTTGVASLASTLTANGAALTLSGSTFDIAFNPVPDRLRIVSDTGQNLRVNVDTGATTVDGVLNNNGATASGIVAAAYTNQNAGATATTLYTLDAANGTLNVQNPPNNGTQTVVGPTGAPQLTSFDIDAATGIGYVGDGGLFGSIDLGTGTASGIGLYGISNVVDFAVVPGAPAAVPEPFSLALLGMGLGGTLLLRRRTVRPA